MDTAVEKAARVVREYLNSAGLPYDRITARVVVTVEGWKPSMAALNLYTLAGQNDFYIEFDEDGEDGTN